MNRDIKAISRMVPPPSKPVGLNRPWATVEKALGLKLPTDYKDFIDLYGSGMFCEFLSVWNFRDASLFGKKPLKEMLSGPESVIRWYLRVGEMNGGQWPYPMYPDAGGLVPFASVVDVHNLNWLTKGKPDDWSVVYWFSDGQEFTHLEGDTFGRCLLKMLRHEYKGLERPGGLEPPHQFTKRLV